MLLVPVVCILMFRVKGPYLSFGTLYEVYLRFRTSFEVEIQYMNSPDRITQSFNIATLE